MLFELTYKFPFGIDRSEIAEGMKTKDEETAIDNFSD
jgi:hypothetical protein